MTTQELIQKSKQAMEDLWNLNQGKLLEHEQRAYNCLRLLIKKVESITPVYPTIDESGHWYVIPLDKKEEFIRLSRHLEETDYENGDDIVDFNNKFSKYMTGGSLNFIQLYSKNKLT